MKIAIPITTSNKIDDHFGHCESYNVYHVSEKNEILIVQSIKSPQGCGCKSNIASVLANEGVTVMLAGGIGGGAINVLNNEGIKVIRGCIGDPLEALKKYLDGSLIDSGTSCQQHESHQKNGDHMCNH